MGPGYRLGVYVLGEKLGGGSMGVVFRARHVRLKKEFALKVLSPRLACDPEAAQRFDRETEALGRLEHINLVRASDAGVENGTPFVVMELLDGMDLAELTKRCGPWPVAEACAAVRQAALGLQHAHERGLVHRDIKPANLWLTSAGVVKVLDLGLARLCAGEVDPSPSNSLTGAGRMMGSPNYVAPEQILDSRHADIRADLYSLGCTLFHLLTAKPPFDDSTHASIAQTLEAHLKEPPPDVRTRRSDVPDALAAVLKRLLAKRPEDRYATPAELAAALEPFAAEAHLSRMLQEDYLPSTLPLPTQKDPSWQRARRLLIGLTRSKSSCTLTLAFAMTVAVLVGLPTWWWFDRSRTSPNGIPDTGPKPSGLQVLTIPALRVRRFVDAGANHEHLGILGEKTFHTDKDDLVEVEAELSEPAYAYLLAFNPAAKADDQIQLCWPRDKDSPPQRQGQIIFPPKGRFCLNDGVGLQAFALIASRQPLPSYAEWRRQTTAFSWKKTAATSGFVWRADEHPLHVLKGVGDDRGVVIAMPEKALLSELNRWLRSAPNVETVSLIAFAVDP